ncbi:thioredoxin domain-containing protein [Gangjinia marincola]|uniref:Thioredoxin domain-containing protein n=1 Tax=Gangjinia marincola TaxID=578463 RepID=A0ABN1MEH2_9FLAO
MDFKQNNLTQERSPYLLQHKNNPVHWQAYLLKTLDHALTNDTLILISIGYAACHWCHVMEHECFEDEEVAAIMNEHYVNIKVDREERPDVDAIYMKALQLMTGQGGWPLNVIALPNGKPVWGGTYLNKKQWMGILHQLADLYQTDPEKMREYSHKLYKGISDDGLIPAIQASDVLKADLISSAVEQWSAHFDHQWGGLNYSPKFMMPVNYGFLMHYGYRSGDKMTLPYTLKTLDMMSYGGVYDHLGGGFSRYSVDERWHVPHFEKMLYDNAQLVTLYSNAYKLTKNEWYKDVVVQTLQFIARELTHESGAFYASLDADSLNAEGNLVEGAYYVWTKAILQELLQENYALFADYYNVNDFGKWEDEHYVLIRKETLEEISVKHNLSQAEAEAMLNQSKQVVLNHRNTRSKPRLDNKCLTSWNALMSSGCLEAYTATQNDSYLEIAQRNISFLLKNVSKKDGGLFHTWKKGRASINGFLEDYAAVIEALINLYQVSFQEKWLHEADRLAQYCLDQFYSEEKKLFYFTPTDQKDLISRSIEHADNVIPASNSIMAKNLWKLSGFFGNTLYRDIARAMLEAVTPLIEKYPSSYANWLDLALLMTTPFYEIAITGKDAFLQAQRLNMQYIPHIIIAATEQENELPLLQHRFNEETTFYICQDLVCGLPKDSLAEVMKEITPPQNP